MKVAPSHRLAWLAALALVPAGCRTAGPPPAARPLAPAEPRLTFHVEDFVEEHNRNAKRLQSLEAKGFPISVTMVDHGRSKSGVVYGRLAWEQPRNFKLVLTHHMSDMADIGSNEERFWFWVNGGKDKSVYVCDYGDLASTSLALSYQPDWIVEAVGLRPIPSEDVAGIRVKPGTEPDTTLVTLPLRQSGGQTYRREMVVSDLDQRVKQYRVYQGQTLIARATIKKYSSLPLGDGEGADEGASGVFPEQVVLSWVKEQLSLDVTLNASKVSVNKFNPERRTALFVEPKVSGYTRVNLAELSPSRAPDTATTVRETMPPPPSGSGSPRVRLSPPLQIQGDRAGVPAARAPSDEPERTARNSGLLLPVLEEVVGAPMPTAPGSPIGQTAHAGTSAGRAAIGR